jgi:hypothetical protein
LWQIREEKKAKRRHRMRMVAALEMTQKGRKIFISDNKQSA